MLALVLTLDDDLPVPGGGRPGMGVSITLAAIGESAKRGGAVVLCGEIGCGGGGTCVSADWPLRPPFPTPALASHPWRYEGSTWLPVRCVHLCFFGFIGLAF